MNVQTRSLPPGPGAGRICHVNLAKDYRGGERQTEILVRELAERGWAQRLVVRPGQELAERCAEIPDLEIVADRGNPLTAAWAIRGASISHAHEARAVYSGWYASRRYGVPSILTRRLTKTLKSSWLRDRSYRAAAAVTAISSAAADNVRGRYPDLDVEIVPDSHSGLEVDAEDAAALRARYEGKFVIGHVGSYIHETKGQLTIIEVARRAQSERPDWHFLLLGGGRDEELFRERIGDLNNIELVGFVDNLGDYYLAFDLFVFPSLHEALGSSLLDALRFGLPVVASRVGGIPETIADGVNGILVDPEAPDQLMEGIAAIANDDEKAGAMHLANRLRAESYSASAMAEAYEKIYRRFL